MEGFDWWEETAPFGTSDEFIVPDVHPTPPSTDLWVLEPINHWSLAHTAWKPAEMGEDLP